MMFYYIIIIHKIIIYVYIFLFCATIQNNILRVNNVCRTTITAHVDDAVRGTRDGEKYDKTFNDVKIKHIFERLFQFLI